MIKLSTLFQVKSVHIFINQPDLLSLTPNTCAQALVVRIVQFKMGTNPSASHLQNGRWHKRESAEMFQLVLERRSKSAWWWRAFPIWKKRIFDLGFLWPYFNMISVSFKFGVFLSSISHLKYRWDWLKVRKGALYLNDNDSQKGHNSFISSSLSGRVAYLYFMNTLIINATQRIEWNLKHRYWKYHLLQGCNLGSR